MDKIKRDELAIEECGRRYIRLCPESVLADYKHYPAEIKQLKTELQSILELSGISNTEVRGSNISDPTGDTAVRRVDLSMQIAVLEHMALMVEAALSQLEQQHREVLELFFFKKGYTGHNVQDYAEEHYMSVASVYRARRIALTEFGDLFEQYL